MFNAGPIQYFRCLDFTTTTKQCKRVFDIGAFGSEKCGNDMKSVESVKSVEIIWEAIRNPTACTRFSPLSHLLLESNLKGSFTIFYFRSGLIFWIVMRCGIADFGRRAL